MASGEHEGFNPKKVTGVEFPTEDSIMYYQLKYADGSRGPRERTSISDTGSRHTVQVEMNRVRAEHGLEPLEIQR